MNPDGSPPSLERLHWHESFSVGVHAIDEQHRRLFDLVNRLSEAVGADREAAVLEGIFADVVNYTKVHFTSEEALLREHPAFQEHRNEHKRFVEDLGRLRAETGLDGRTQAERLLRHLADWLRNHILQSDIAIFNQVGFRSPGSAGAYEERLRLIAQRPTILLVEDSAVERRLLKRWLDRAGYDVLEAEGGGRALEILARTSGVHLVITDLGMEGGDGFDLIRAIRESRAASVYVMVVTGRTEKASLIQAFRLGANDYLTKPVLREELLLRIQNGMKLIRLETEEELVFAMAKLSDFRSPETGQHLERVQVYCRLLGCELAATCPELGLTEGTALEIAKFSPLHDIGKVAIPDAILNKPGRLTPEEFSIMQDHARIGGDLLGRIMTKTGFRSLSVAYALTMHHHERWDGSGYPMGLAGEQIPLPARITALADVYDALTTTRSYKPAYPREEARQVILEASGRHFDPRIVEAFVRLEPRFHASREELADY